MQKKVVDRKISFEIFFIEDRLKVSILHLSINCLTFHLFRLYKMLLLLTLITPLTNAFPLYQAHEEKSFVSWMRKNNVLYTSDEYNIRFGIYLTNSRYVQEHNAGNPSFKLSLNQFSTYTPSEYKALLGFKVSTNMLKDLSKNIDKNEDNEFKISTSCDWRKEGVVNVIKDQGQCGSCWAFSAIQTIESTWAIGTGTLESFSEQNLLDCFTWACFGCQGGTYFEAFVDIYSRQSGKCNRDSEYPYTATDGNECEFKNHSSTGKLWKYIHTINYNDTDVARACEQYGPIASAMDASHPSFQLYHSGLYDEPQCDISYLNHAIGIVGFGVSEDTNYFLVRNSWGKSWGEEGYVRMIWGNNQCGLSSMAYYTVHKLP
ncbi:Cysteine proteinase 3 [Tritrichomonas foetus]|uniref:Cysteine proteinase 3 n=1 Tax=Tritrichomonas foetus TaxID=1144522 RepID=A0A1J4J8A7_9EUKA|nr:Cysteine proteinase 3 [Tritrichomonas foetus]|eukprot:OHS93637.1 Cysteine proteinase 3 [Tritrichomonas foetus]